MAADARRRAAPARARPLRRRPRSLGEPPARLRGPAARASPRTSTSSSPPASPTSGSPSCRRASPRLLDDPEALLLGRPDGLGAEERDRLVASLARFEETCGRLAAAGLPETIQHDDLHDGNVFVDGRAYRIFDWGDSCVSHPFHTLVVTLRALAHRLALEPGGGELVRLRDAYLEPFSAYGTHAELVAAADLAHVTGTAARALAWHRFVEAREPRFRGEDAEAVPYGLRRLLDPGPLGSWS